MRVLISVAASLMLMLALVGPVAAGGCKAFGAATVDAAHNARPFGQIVSGVAHNGITIPGFGSFASVSELVQAEHGLYCAK